MFHLVNSLFVVLTVIIVVTLLESFLIMGPLVWYPQMATPKERMPAEWKTMNEEGTEGEEEGESDLEDANSEEDESSVRTLIGPKSYQD